MRPTAILLSLIGVLAAGPATAEACLGQRRGEPPEAACFELAVGGTTRTYRLFVPDNLGPAPAPLVLVLHGGGGSAAGMESASVRGFHREARRAGFVVAYPEGLGRNWNDGRPDAPHDAARQDRDDVGFIAALIEALGRRRAIDRGRVYATGISNGGMMSYRLACELADRIAAVAAVAAQPAPTLIDRCRPARPVGILIVNGTADPIVPYTGGEVRILGLSRGRVMGSVETFAAFAGLMDCRRRDPGLRRGRETAEPTGIETWAAAGCRDGVAVELISVIGGGHAWPSGTQYLPERLVGPVSREVDGAELIWAFFERHRRS